MDRYLKMLFCMFALAYANSSFSSDVQNFCQLEKRPSLVVADMEGCGYCIDAHGCPTQQTVCIGQCDLNADKNACVKSCREKYQDCLKNARDQCSMHCQ